MRWQTNEQQLLQPALHKPTSACAGPSCNTSSLGIQVSTSGLAPKGEALVLRGQKYHVDKRKAVKEWWWAPLELHSAEIV